MFRKSLARNPTALRSAAFRILYAFEDTQACLQSTDSTPEKNCCRSFFLSTSAPVTKEMYLTTFVHKSSVCTSLSGRARPQPSRTRRCIATPRLSTFGNPVLTRANLGRCLLTGKGQPNGFEILHLEKKTALFAHYKWPRPDRAGIFVSLSHRPRRWLASFLVRP